MQCPRWRLTTPHYLKIETLPDGTRVEWEHKETNKANGRAVRKLFAVPLLLNPDDPNDHNHPDGIVVTHDVEGASGVGSDYVFEGSPTPDMEPLNAEAEAITAAMRPRWEHPIDTLPVNGGMNSQEAAFMQSMMAEFAKQVGANVPAPNASVPREEYNELKERLARLEALLAAQNATPAAPVTRRA